MANKEHLHKLLSDAIPVLCRNGLPPSVTFRVEALIGITVMDDSGGNTVDSGNVTLLSFQQTVSDSGVIASKFGSSDPVASGSDDVSTASHTPHKRQPPKQAAPATMTIKQEYTVETSVKQEYDAESYPSYAGVTHMAGDYGTGDTEDVQYIEEDGEYAGEEEYYEDDGQYYDDGSGYLPVDTYMEGDSSYMQTDYMAGDFGSGPAPKYKKPRLSAQPGPSKVRKTGGAARGGTRPRAGRTSQDQATAIAVR